LHDVQRAEVGLQAKVTSAHEVSGPRRVRRQLVSGEVIQLRRARMDAPQRVGEARQILFARRRDDVDIVRRPPLPVRCYRDATDQDVLDAALVQEPQQRFRIERVHPAAQPRPRLRHD
jgi:hypothetical protein